MKVLVINGSPKGKKSNTLRLTQAFLDGLGAREMRSHSVSRMEIKPCLGCFSCWTKTPGKCCIQDDMAQVIEDYLWADVIIWSFPLYYFTVPGGLKNLIDRQLPMVLPFMASDAEFGSHPARYDLSGKRHVVISTCGFYTAQGNYEGVQALFDHMVGKGKYETIFCGQGELFRVPELGGRTGEYLSQVEKAGQEFAAGGISRETGEQLRQLLFPREVFEAMADASWGVEKTGEKTDETLTFTRQMAALYNKNAYNGKDLILEMVYTDEEKCYQIILGENGSQVLTDSFREYTTRIETPYTVWKAIAAGELEGASALAQGKYKVKGDFSLMLRWDHYFGTGEEKKAQKSSEPVTTMNQLLIPWIVFWAAGAIHGFYGALASLAACALVPVIYRAYRRTVYDVLTPALVTAFAVLLLLNVEARIVMCGSYFAFGAMWALSCLGKIPLTAHYSMNDYNGEKALNNPLFMKTNRILTAAWGVLYLLTPIWTYFLMGGPLAQWTGAVNSLLPMAMGIFTAWFQKWYPAKVARGE